MFYDKEVFCEDTSGVIPRIQGRPQRLSLNRRCHTFFSPIGLQTETLDLCHPVGLSSALGNFPRLKKKRERSITWQPADKARGTAETPGAKSAFRKRDPVTGSTRGRSLAFHPVPGSLHTRLPASQASLAWSWVVQPFLGAWTVASLAQTSLARLCDCGRSSLKLSCTSGQQLVLGCLSPSTPKSARRRDRHTVPSQPARSPDHRSSPVQVRVQPREEQCVLTGNVTQQLEGGKRTCVTDAG